MDNKFNIGDKVVCINAKRNWYCLGGLKKNEVYTIKAFNPVDGGLVLEEIQSPNSGYGAYNSERFRKLDYNFVEHIIDTLRPSKNIILGQFENIILN